MEIKFVRDERLKELSETSQIKSELNMAYIKAKDKFDALAEAYIKSDGADAKEVLEALSESRLAYDAKRTYEENQNEATDYVFQWIDVEEKTTKPCTSIIGATCYDMSGKDSCRYFPYTRESGERIESFYDNQTDFDVLTIVTPLAGYYKNDTEMSVIVCDAQKTDEIIKKVNDYSIVIREHTSFIDEERNDFDYQIYNPQYPSQSLLCFSDFKVYASDDYDKVPKQYTLFAWGLGNEQDYVNSGYKFYDELLADNKQFGLSSYEPKSKVSGVFTVDTADNKCGAFTVRMEDGMIDTVEMTTKDGRVTVSEDYMFEAIPSLKQKYDQYQEENAEILGLNEYDRDDR